jgi:TonB-linked SusC/RagA family outer membrane protein
MVWMGLLFVATSASAQQRTVTGKVTTEAGAPMEGVSVGVKGTTVRVSTNAQGTYSIRADAGQVLQFRSIGTSSAERTVGADNVINVSLRRVATNLNAVVVTALGQTANARELGTAQQTVSGTDIVQTQRENFVDALQGRIAGVDVTSTSGVPGASASITIRGVSSISSSNQPLMIVDGLPMDNTTLNTGVLASDAPGSATAFSNRGVDFTNRAADLNPDDIESITVLKGPEAAVLYGIDAANGAIVITTKRGTAGGGFQYNNSFRWETTGAKPQLQRVFGPTSSSGGLLGSFQYFGAPYPAGTVFYNNIDNFLRTGTTQTHNLSFSGASQDSKVTYRLSTAMDRNNGVVPTTDFGRTNVTAAASLAATSWLNADATMAYTYDNNDQVYKGDTGPLIDLMLWPQTDDATNYLNPSGTRRRLTSASTNAGETDNPYFNIAKNKINSKNNRIIANVGLQVIPFSWGNFKTNIGTDYYTDQNLLLRNPESFQGAGSGGILDNADLINRNISAQTLFKINPHKFGNSLSISGLVGNAVLDQRSVSDAAVGTQFLDPNFISINNTNLRSSRQTISQRRLIGAFGQAIVGFRDYLYLTFTGRNDWTSTIPVARNSFFYPGVSSSFIFSDAFPGIRRFMTGKLRAAYAAVGRDATPYAYTPSLEYKTTSYGGYGYGFTGPNPLLKPEFAKSRELGTELSFLNERLGLDATVFRKLTTDQIVQNIRTSYATGFILLNLNGASTRTSGLELTLRGTPIQRANFSWDFQANYTHVRGVTLSLPAGLPETYVSDTWLYGNLRNGTEPGLSTMSLTGLFYLRDTVKGSPAYGKVLIDPTSGLPLRSPSLFIDAGYDRQPKYTVGLSNTLRYNRITLDFLLDFRRGGDVFNATEHYLTTHGLSMETLDRNTPRVLDGVLRDGKEGSANPTPNNIVIIPAQQTGYYTNMSEEAFIEKNINWVRLRDIQVSYALPNGIFGAKNMSLFVKGTDLWLKTNYVGLDPIVNGNDAAVGGSGGAGIDFGNFPMPKGFNFGLRMGF